MSSGAITEPVLLILLSLAARPLHGCAILRDDVAHSDGRVRLSTGALYGAVRRLFPERWIKRVREKGAP